VPSQHFGPPDFRNLTGVTGLGTELGPKRLELLNEVLPKTTVTAALVNQHDGDQKRLKAAAYSCCLETQGSPSHDREPGPRGKW
jgi:hypothetical protein